MVQVLPSAQGVPAGFGAPAAVHGQAAAFSTFTQPKRGSHESFVHGLPSSHPSGIAVPMHWPCRHASSVVQRLPSSHGAKSGRTTFVQPPAPQVSTVQSLPSSQSASDGVAVQPAAGSHASIVQAIPSSQVAGGWVQTPATHTAAVQTSASPGQTVPDCGL